MSGTLVRREPDTLDYVAEYERLKAGCVAAALDRHQLSREDAEGLYQTAWIELWQYARAGNVVHDLRAFLIDVMTKRWRDELRRSHRRHESLGVEEGLADVAAAVLAEPDAGVYDDRVQINFAAEVLATTLDDESLRRVFYLIWFEGLSREAAVSAAGLVWNRTMAKRLDRVAKRLRKSLGAVRAGDWCEHQRVLLQDFALGRLGGRRGRVPARPPPSRVLLGLPLLRPDAARHGRPRPTAGAAGTARVRRLVLRPARRRGRRARGWSGGLVGRRGRSRDRRPRGRDAEGDRSVRVGRGAGGRGRGDHGGAAARPIASSGSLPARRAAFLATGRGLAPTGVARDDRRLLQPRLGRDGSGRRPRCGPSRRGP